ARSDRPWVWDVVGALAVLAALGCKNTFAVLVPAQMLLRIAPEGHGWAAGLRRHGRRAVLLALTLLLPIVHYVCFRLNWHPGQYPPTGPSLGQLVDMLRTIKGALSLEWLAAGWLMAAMAVTVAGRWVNVWQDYRPAWLAGGVLALLGLAVYLPVRGAAGRYAMPAVWGVDLMVATLLSAAEEVPSIWWRRAGWGAVAAGLVVVAITNLARQEKFAARAALLWQIVETLEQQAPPGSRIDWMAGPDLNAEEGVHVAWHLEGRGRVDLRLRVVSAEGAPLGRVELPAAATEADFLVSVAPPSEADGWRLAREFTVPYWWGRRVFRCSLWER
ncbi:MAG: hypothetical protein NZ700_03830, partial [Gemmataceae bacterium]|nr:hypothetical protein [Gemmataceae bacterium]